MPGTPGRARACRARRSSRRVFDHALEERLAVETASSASPDLLPVLGANLRRLRTKRGLSLERLSKLSGVSRAMLSQVELAYSVEALFPAHFGVSDFTEPSLDAFVRNALDASLHALIEQVRRDLTYNAARASTAHVERAHDIVAMLAAKLPGLRVALEHDIGAAYDGDPRR